MPRGRPKKQGNQYNLSLTIGTDVYKTAGKTLEEAIANIPLKWNQVKAKGIMNITQGTRKHEHLFYIRILRRILVNDIARGMWAKRLELFLK